MVNSNTQGSQNDSVQERVKSLEDLIQQQQNETQQENSERQFVQKIQTNHVQQFFSDNQRDLYLFEDVYKGIQKHGISIIDGNSNQQIPLNHFTQSNTEQKLKILQEKSLQKMMQMAQKLNSVNKLSQGNSLQVMEKDREWKEKHQQLKNEYESQLSLLKTQLDSAQNDKQLISKNYEAQLKMLSEHIVELNQQQEKLKRKKPQI